MRVSSTGATGVERQKMSGAGDRVLPNPALLRDVLADVRFAPIWLVLRVVLGWLWLEAGWSRLQEASGSGDPLAVGLTLAGIALILGVLTGPAAFVGGCLSIGLWDSAGVQAVALLFAATVWLVLAWKTAGWIGLDRWLLPLLGMPWRGGVLFDGDSERERSNR
jgi:thiosulfate dehydrogenase (quinone) large subunit